MSPFFASEILPLLPCPGLGSGLTLHNPPCSPFRHCQEHTHTHTIHTNTYAHSQSGCILLVMWFYITAPSSTLFSLSLFIISFFSLHILPLHNFTLLYSTLFYTTLLLQSTPAIQDPLGVSSYHFIPSHLISLWRPRFTRIYSTLPPCTRYVPL